ncbi:YjgN family protein [Kluyvera sp. 142486]|uniref:YjgN family protein n=1 Tax=Kluyvera sp. 142486 TaxID=3390050 RepID=UPI003980C6BF
MNHSLVDENREVHAFHFHGKGSSFFMICLVNVLLSIITCGIFLPWAFVRSRRYIYENMELNGARFDYHAKGSALFLSWLIISIIIAILCFIEFTITHSEEIIFAPWVIMLFFPCMAVKSLNYHAAMTSLNNVHFGFHCSMLRAWWVTLGMPILAVVLLLFVFSGWRLLLGEPSNLNALLIRVACGLIISAIVFAIINGIVYRNWIELFAKNTNFGIHKFNLTLNTSKCIIISLISLAIIVPFLLVIVKVLMASFNRILLGSLDGLGGLFTLTYLLYIVGLLISFAYAFAALRNYAFNNLTLDNDIRFHSSITFIGMAINLLLLTFGSLLTLGLAYPWLKIRFVRYQANHTTVSGHLDALELTNDNRPLDTGIFARISRGAAPTLPFF